MEKHHSRMISRPNARSLFFLALCDFVSLWPATVLQQFAGRAIALV